MPIDDPKVVDAMATVRATGEVVLAVSDHLPWDDPDHLRILEAKLNTYLGFIESGKVHQQYPASIGAPLRIDVVCKYRPSADGERYLALAREMVEKAGCQLSWRVLAA